MDEYTLAQFRRNEALIKVSDPQPECHVIHVYAGEENKAEFGICENCKREVDFRQLERNGGVCDHYALFGYCI